MTFKYIKETDSFFVIFSDKKSADSFEIAEGVVVDVDDSGVLIGIEFFSAKNKFDFDDLNLEELPFKNVNFRNIPGIVTA